MIVLFRSDY